MCYVYILQSQRDFNFYTGLTKNITRRLQEHNAGLVRPTRGRRPFNLVYQEKFETVAQARQKEKYFKTGAGREFRDKMLKNNIPR